MARLWVPGRQKGEETSQCSQGQHTDCWHRKAVDLSRSLLSIVGLEHNWLYLIGAESEVDHVLIILGQFFLRE